MKTETSKLDSRRGSALLTIIILILIASAFVATLVTVSVSRTFMAKKLAERVKAIAIAEAGISKAYSDLSANFELRTNALAFPVTAYAGGVYDVSVTCVGSNEASICSTGVYGSVTEVTMLDVRNSEPGTTGWGGGPSPYEYAVVSGGTINWSGASTFYGSKAHSNGKFTRSGSGLLNANVSSSVEFESKGNAGGIDGDVSAPELSGNLSNITGSQSAENVSLVNMPDIDLTPYYNEALANGEVVNGNLTLSSDYTPDGGILWVNGDLNLSGNTTYTGCFIATGDITVSGGGSITKVESYPTIVSRDGDVSFTGTKDVTGLIYVKMGDYTQTGGNTLTGQIIVGGDVNKAGVSTVINYVDSTPVPPGGGEDSGDTILGVTAWQQ